MWSHGENIFKKLKIIIINKDNAYCNHCIGTKRLSQAYSSDSWPSWHIGWDTHPVISNLLAGSLAGCLQICVPHDSPALANRSPIYVSTKVLGTAPLTWPYVGYNYGGYHCLSDSSLHDLLPVIYAKISFQNIPYLTKDELVRLQLFGLSRLCSLSSCSCRPYKSIPCVPPRRDPFVWNYWSLILWACVFTQYCNDSDEKFLCDLALCSSAMLWVVGQCTESVCSK